MADPKAKECDHCGRTFECGPGTGENGDCWCGSLPNVVPFEAGQDCLCPECLKEQIEDHGGEI